MLTGLRREQAGRVVGATRFAEGTEAADLAAVNQYALKPQGAEDVAIFQMDLCNDQVDRHFSRFPKEELAKINGMVPGRPLMERHDMRGSLPRGTFFRSGIHEEGGVMSVRPEVYVLRTKENEEFIRQIEGGVYRETSIGFVFERPECAVCGKDMRVCEHIAGRMYEGKQCHYLMRNVVDVIEGSVVGAGSQGTGFVAARRVEELGGCARDPGYTKFRDCCGCGECGKEKEVRITNDELRMMNEERPYPTEHACRIEDPKKFRPETFVRMDRRHEGKVYHVIMGKKKGGDDSLEDQAFRYKPAEGWEASQAAAHCRSHGGKFEAATGGKSVEDGGDVWSVALAERELELEKKRGDW
jgi:hypothetical protein